jgi:hypothetical protein
MSSSGLFIEENDDLRPLPEAIVATEDDLQALVARYPVLLSGDDDAAADRRWLLIRREQGIAAADGASDRFALDHLFVDQDGVPTLVEVKRAADTRARREVVAQMLDYAANARSFLDPGALKATFEEEYAVGGDHAQAHIQTELGADANSNDLWEKFGANLRSGTLRLIFLADHIPEELRTLVEFLNEQMVAMEVIAVEVATFKTEDDTTVVRARTIGQTQASRTTKGRSPSKKWDRQTWMASLMDQVGPEVADVATRIFTYAEERGLSETFGSGSQLASVQHGLNAEDAYVFPFLIYNNGGVEVAFQTMISAPYPPFAAEAKRLELRDRLQAITGIDLKLEKISKRPNVQLSSLRPEAAFQTFTETFDWILAEARAAGR